MLIHGESAEHEAQKADRTPSPPKVSTINIFLVLDPLPDKNTCNLTGVSDGVEVGVSHSD